METVYLVDCTKFQVHEGEKFQLKNSSKFHDKEMLLENSKRFHVQVSFRKKFLCSNWKKFDKKTLINFMYTKEKSLIGKLSGIPSTQSGKS